MKSIINKQLPLDIQEMILENSIIANIKDLKINKDRYGIFAELFSDHQLTEKHRKLLKLLSK